MLKAEYTRKINNSILIITPEKDFDTEKESISMFQYNEIPYFLKMGTQRKNIELQFCYDITSQRSLNQLLEFKSLDYTILQMILDSFDQACMQMEDFMLTENDIMMKPEYIFVDHNMEHVSYCYLPGFQSDICEQFKDFMEYLLQHLNHKDEQAMQLAYGVYQKVTEEKTALHKVLREPDLIKEYCVRSAVNSKSLFEKTDDEDKISIMNGIETDEQRSDSCETDKIESYSGTRQIRIDRQYSGMQDTQQTQQNADVNNVKNLYLKREVSNGKNLYMEQEVNSEEKIRMQRGIGSEEKIQVQREKGNREKIQRQRETGNGQNNLMKEESGDGEYIMYVKENNQQYTCMDETGKQDRYKNVNDIENYRRDMNSRVKNKSIQYKGMQEVDTIREYNQMQEMKRSREHEQMQETERNRKYGQMQEMERSGEYEQMQEMERSREYEQMQEIERNRKYGQMQEMKRNGEHEQRQVMGRSREYEQRKAEDKNKEYEQMQAAGINMPYRGMQETEINMPYRGMQETGINIPYRGMQEEEIDTQDADMWGKADTSIVTGSRKSQKLKKCIEKEGSVSKTDNRQGGRKLKNRLKKAEKLQDLRQQETEFEIHSDDIQKKETLRRQAAEKLKSMLMKKIYTDRIKNENQNTVFEADEEELMQNNPTVCLIQKTDEIYNRFVYQGADRSRDFNCSHGKLLIGSAAEESDICIPFPMISRVHAVIQTDEQGTFLEDMNSTNGTHVNGELLQYHERRMLKKGDIISLAGECYSFH